MDTSEAAVDCQMLRTVEPTCAVCWNTTKVPSLSCMHRICWGCLKQLNKLECPTCRARITLPDVLNINIYNGDYDRSGSDSGSETNNSDSEFECESEDESESS